VDFVRGVLLGTTSPRVDADLRPLDALRTWACPGTTAGASSDGFSPAAPGAAGAAIVWPETTAVVGGVTGR
jgi:hypothetical protein